MILIICISIKSFSISFLDPAINRIMIYIDKDGANNYAFIRGMTEEQEKQREKFVSLGFLSYEMMSNSYIDKYFGISESASADSGI